MIKIQIATFFTLFLSKALFSSQEQGEGERLEKKDTGSLIPPQPLEQGAQEKIKIVPILETNLQVTGDTTLGTPGQKSRNDQESTQGGPEETPEDSQTGQEPTKEGVQDSEEEGSKGQKAQLSFKNRNLGSKISSAKKLSLTTERERDLQDTLMLRWEDFIRTQGGRIVFPCISEVGENYAILYFFLEDGNLIIRLQLLPIDSYVEKLKKVTNFNKFIKAVFKHSIFKENFFSPITSYRDYESDGILQGNEISLGTKKNGNTKELQATINLKLFDVIFKDEDVLSQEKKFSSDFLSIVLRLKDNGSKQSPDVLSVEFKYANSRATNANKDYFRGPIKNKHLNNGVKQLEAEENQDSLKANEAFCWLLVRPSVKVQLEEETEKAGLKGNRRGSVMVKNLDAWSEGLGDEKDIQSMLKSLQEGEEGEPGEDPEEVEDEDEGAKQADKGHSTTKRTTTTVILWIVFGVMCVFFLASLIYVCVRINKKE